MLVGAEDVIRQAPRMGWNASQIAELEVEADFYGALVTDAATVPRPSDAIVKAVQDAIEGWQEVVDWIPTEPLTAEQAANRNALASRLTRLRRSMDFMH